MDIRVAWADGVDGFVKGRCLAGRPPSNAEVDHPDDGDVASERKRQDIADSNELARSFHGAGIDAYPAFCAVGRREGAALAETSKPQPLVESPPGRILVHCGGAPPARLGKSAKTEKGDKGFFLGFDGRWGTRRTAPT